MRKNVRYLVCAVMFLFLSGKISCQKIIDYEFQPPNVRFDNFLVKNGEASQESTCILIDSKGFLWSGTETGLYRFDGTRYVNYGVTRGNYKGFTGFTVLDIFEDSEGTIWTGTSEALNKLDQKTGIFTPFIPDPAKKGGPSNFIRAIREDSDSLLWILTRKEIFSFDRNEEKFTKFDTDSLSWFPENSMLNCEDQCFAEDSHGNKWFVTFSGLYLFNNKNKAFRKILPDPDKTELNNFEKVRCVTADKNGNVWIGTEGAGLLRWNDTENRPETIEIKPKGNNGELFNSVSTVLTGKNGFIWSFGNGTFSNYNIETRKVENYIIRYRNRTVYESPGSNVWINQAFQYDDGTIWFFNQVAGLLFRFNPVSEKLSLYRTPYFMVYQCIMDKTGSFWFACIRNNIFRLEAIKIPFLAVQVPNSAHVVQIHKTNILEDNQKRIWFLFNLGTRINKNFDVNSAMIFDHFIFPGRDTLAGRGFRDSKGNLWFVAKRGKILKYNPDLDTLKELTPSYSPDMESNYIPVVREDKDGNIWIAHPVDGLYMLARGEEKPVHIIDLFHRTSESGFILMMDFLIDSQNNFWLLTGEKFLRITMPGMKIYNYTDYGNDFFSVFGSNIRIEEDNKGNVWILNSRSGLFRFNRLDESFTKVDVTDEGPETQFYDLLADRTGRIWIVDNRGITIFNPTDKSKRIIKTPRLQFDIQSCQISSGEILFLNHNQLYVFNENVPVNNIIPPVYITSLLVNGTDYNKIIKNSGDEKTLSKIDLPFGQNNLNIEFAALNYLNPEQNMYRYFMTGMDEDTVMVGPGLPAEYKQMVPGRYKFWVTGSNNDGIWNPSGVSLDIRIHPPWYRSKLAYVIYFLVFISVMVGYIKLRTYRLIKDKMRLREEIETATVELENKNSQLAEMDRLKTHFFTDISHEIRTPLSLILGPLENISKEEMLSNRMSQMIDLMKRNAQRLKHLVNQLLDISRLDAGKMKITLIEDDINKCLRILVYEFLSMAESRHIKYIVDITDNIFKTWFDRDKIEKIISNLLSNAFKYTPQDGQVQCIIRIETSKNSGSLPVLRIKIIDSGPGISEEYHHRVFDRFYRVEGHNEAESQGTGIGLSLVKEFVSLLHGEIKIISSPGRGSNFSVSIPLGIDHLSQNEYVKARFPEEIADRNIESFLGQKFKPDEIGKSGMGKLKILIIEDNKDLRNFIKDSLCANYTILEAENGTAGLNVAVTMMPDLIVTDIMMPDLDGMKLCSHLKNDELTSHIPVIILTAWATSDDRVAGLKSGADDYIIKPFIMTELETRISNLLELRVKLRLKYGKFRIAGQGHGFHESIDDRFMMKVLKIVDVNLRNYNFDVGSLPEQLGMSRTHLTRKIKILTGLSPGVLIRNIRLEKAAEMLKAKAGNITEVSNSVGISNPSNFTKAFRNYFGISPKKYLKH